MPCVVPLSFGPHSDILIYTVTDSHGSTDTATVTITVNVDETVTAAADSNSGTDDGPLVTGNVLDNDSGESLSVVTPGTFTTALGGSYTIDAAGDRKSVVEG